MNEKRPYASFYERLLSRFIDSLIYSMILLIPLVKISTINVFTILLDNIYNYILFLLIIASFIFFFEIFIISEFGGTLGKLLIGLRIQHENGKFLSLKDSFIRLTLGRAVSGIFFGLGYLWIFKNAKHQAWHDMVNETVVVRKLSHGYLIGLVIIIAFIIINLGIFAGIFSGFIYNLPFYQNLKF